MRFEGVSGLLEKEDTYRVLLVLGLVFALFFVSSVSVFAGTSSNNSDGDGLDNSDYSKITIESLLDEMIDLERLAFLPPSGNFTAQASSYDRASRIENGMRENWFANEDSGNFVRKIERENRTEYVLADLEGPGAVVRFWSANPAGILRVYIDNSVSPVIEGSLKSILNGEKGYPFTSPFVDVRAWGSNLYFPIPFSENILVTCENPENLYYHIGYRVFPEDIEVESYSQANVMKAKSKAERISDRLSNPYTTWTHSENSQIFEIDWQIQQGEIEEISFTGPAEIIGIDLGLDAENVENVLRNSIIRITWDNYEKPSVWVPLGDFFGTGPGFNPYRSLPLGMLENGRVYSRWVMPFEEKANLEIVNESGENFSLDGRIITRPVDWDNSYLYFHAKWKTDYPVSTVPKRDWNFLQTVGPGRFVGVSFSVANPTLIWWGEGDEKIYVDGENFPSTFGTGTEDYFGYAWGNPSVFSSAYHSQPRADGPVNYGHVSNNRFHIIDSIPFSDEFRFDMEIWHWRDTEIGVSAVSYWYTKSVNEDSYDIPVSSKDREIVSFPPLLVLPVVGTGLLVLLVVVVGIILSLFFYSLKR